MYSLYRKLVYKIIVNGGGYRITCFCSWLSPSLQPSCSSRRRRRKSSNSNSKPRRESSNQKARTTQRPKRRIRNGQPLVPFPAAAVGKKGPGGAAYCSAAASHLYLYWHYNRQVILLCCVPCLGPRTTLIHACPWGHDQDLAEMHVGSDLLSVTTLVLISV